MPPNPSTLAWDEMDDDYEMQSQCCRARAGQLEQGYICGECGKACEVVIVMTGHC